MRAVSGVPGRDANLARAPRSASSDSGSATGGITCTAGGPAGLMSFGSRLTLNGARVEMDLGGTERGVEYDAIDVGTDLSLGGSTLALDSSSLVPPPIGTEFTLIEVLSGSAVGGAFAGLGEGDRFMQGATEFEISYMGGDGNDVVLTVTESSFCYADCDQSSGAGVLDIFDFICFQDAFVGGDPSADCTGDTVLDIFDFVCFQDAFAGGCP